MKKTLVILAIAGLLMGGSTAFAQTTSSSTAQKISDFKSALMLLKSLREGMSGDEVKLLQAALAADPTIYPEGKVTGFYGKLTREAVKRFQKNRGISGDGTTVGPRTMPHINDVLSSAPLGHDRDGDDDHGDKKEGKKLCLKLPPGQLTAPGLTQSHDSDDNDDDRDGHKGGKNGKEKKHGRGARDNGKWNWNDSKMERCKDVGNGTTTPPVVVPPVVTPPADTTAPTISGLSINTTSTTTANALWTTNELATTKIYFGTANPLITSSAGNVGTSTLTLAHVASLTGLTASTTYYAVIESKDAALNTATSSQMTFTTPL